VLTQLELKTLLAALDQGEFGDIVRLLVLTGCRREEIGGLRWTELKWQREMIVLPADRTKNGRQHELPMSTQVKAILDRRYIGRIAPRLGYHRDDPDLPQLPDDGGWVWGRRFTGWSRAKAALDAKLGMSGWTLHDLRRTVATHMAELGVMPHIIEAVLNHVGGHKAGVAGVYNRAKYADEMRAALTVWGDYVERLEPQD
jgi:integrase